MPVHDEIWQAVLTLPPRQRAVLVLRYYEDLTEQQIADVLGCRPGTVKSQASDALASLRTRLDPDAGRGGASMSLEDTLRQSFATAWTRSTCPPGDVDGARSAEARGCGPGAGSRW